MFARTPFPEIRCYFLRGALLFNIGFVTLFNGADIIDDLLDKI